jgi:hypothetical protein
MGRREVRPLLLEDSLGPIRCLTLFPYAPMRIPGDFPEVTVRVLKVTRIAAPKAIPRRVHDRGPRRLGLFHDSVHLGLRVDEVADRKRARSGLR